MLDPATLETGLTSLNIARQALSAAVGIRDFNKAAIELAKLNDSLLNTQNAAFQQARMLFQLQQENAALAQKVQELEEAALQRDSYALFEISDRVYVYRSKSNGQRESGVQPSGLEIQHDICQPCFDQGIKAVLFRRPDPLIKRLKCPICKTEYRF